LKPVLLLVAAVAVAVPGTVSALSSVDPADDARYAWSESAGWVDAYANGSHGVVVGPHLLSGYAWCENVGWLHLGDGAPDAGLQYSNASATDYGVNHDGAGHLSGYAWGENIGWVNFDTSAVSGVQAMVDAGGFLYGYAWSEGLGWINLDSGYGVLLVDSDGDGAPDAFETDTGVFVSAFDCGSDPGDVDTDDDGLQDGVEVQTYDTDPCDADTDDDTYGDGVEIAAGTDPLNPLSHPGDSLPLAWAPMIAVVVVVGAWSAQSRGGKARGGRAGVR